MVVAVIKLVAHGGLLNTMPITEEMLVDFLVEHEIDDADELEEFSQMIHLMLAEPNVPLLCTVH